VPEADGNVIALGERRLEPHEVGAATERHRLLCRGRAEVVGGGDYPFHLALSEDGQSLLLLRRGKLPRAIALSELLEGWLRPFYARVVTNSLGVDASDAFLVTPPEGES
jgi:hypothetical protein